MPLTVGDYARFTYGFMRDDATESGGSSAGGGSQSFAPSTVPQLPEVVIRPPPPRPPSLPTPNVGSRVATAVGTAIARVGGGILALLTPMNSGPDGTGDLYGSDYDPRNRAPQPDAASEPEPQVEALPEVTIRPPRRPAAPVANDPIMPPNWNDLADPGDKIFEAAPGRRPVNDPTRLPFPDFGDRPSPQPFSSPGELPNPDGPMVFPDLMPLPGDTTRPATRPDANPVLPDAFGFPFAFPIGSPGVGPSTVPRPRPSTRPGGRPSAPTPVNPPGIVGLPSMPLPGEPGARPAPPPLGGTSLPDSMTDPFPDILADPSPQLTPDNPTSVDQCQCDKPPKKKKPKPKDRTICRQGTYTQTKKGIKYTPRRVVPCERTESTKPTSRRPSTSDITRDAFTF